MLFYGQGQRVRMPYPTLLTLAYLHGVGTTTGIGVQSA